MPFGETFVEEKSSGSFNNPYKFSGKELDRNTGFYLFGARYYNPKTSLWLSLDPLAELFPSVGGYVYSYNNPVMFNDLSGLEPEKEGNQDTGNNTPCKLCDILKINDLGGLLGNLMNNTKVNSGKDNVKITGNPNHPNPLPEIIIKYKSPCGTCNIKHSDAQEDARKTITRLTNSVSTDNMSQKNVSDKDVDAYQLFYQWVHGTGARKRTFDENSVMGKQLLQTPEVQDGINQAIANYKRTDGDVNYAPFKRVLKNENEIKYAGTFPIDMVNNPARAFHGSFQGKAFVTGEEHWSFGTYFNLNINMSDNMSAGSGTRYPPFLGGYSGKAIFPGENPYGLNGQFRTININYNMNIRVFKPLLFK